MAFPTFYFFTADEIFKKFMTSKGSDEEEEAKKKSNINGDQNKDQNANDAQENKADIGKGYK